MNKNIAKWIKVLVPILIIGVVIGIYAYKKMEEKKENTEKLQVTEEKEEDNSEESKGEKSLSLEISSVDLDEIKSHGIPFVIDFGSDSCIPCQAMAPALKTLHEELQGKAIVHFVDVRKNPMAAKDFPVSLIPTQVFFNADGTPFVPSDDLEKEIEEFTMYKSKDTNEHIFTVHQGGLTEEEMRKVFAEMGVK